MAKKVAPEKSGKQQGKTRRKPPVANMFKPGQSGNPAGRPKGARSRFTEQFYLDLAEDWQEHGKEAMQRVRKEDPSTYLRVAASLLPKDIKLTSDTDATLDKFLNGLNDEQLDELITGLRSLGVSSAKVGADKAAQPTGAKPNSLH